MERIIYEHVVVVGIDGMGNFNKVAKTPFMDELFRNGAVTFDALSMDPTISAENWGAMLLGADPMVHGLTNGIVSQYEYTNELLPSVFAKIREAFPDSYLAGVCNWNPINHGIIEHNLGVDFATAENDEALCPIIEEKIQNKPKFLFIQFDDVDGAGHHFWYGTQGHIDRIEKTDALVERVYRAYEKAGIADDTLFIVVADHGGYRGGHGGYTDTEKYVFFGLQGRGIEKSVIPFAQTKDIAATVLYALGIALPGYDKAAFSSQVPENAFPWNDSVYIMPEPKENIPETRKTPGFDGENGLKNFVDPEKLKLALFFDDEIKDETGKCTLTEKGRIKYYSTGIYGARGELGQTGHISGKGLELSGRGLTFACWVMVQPKLIEDAVLFGNKDRWWENREKAGLEFCMRCGDTLLSLSNDDGNFELVTPFHELVSKGWLHILYVIDGESKEIKVYYNFEFVRKGKLPKGKYPLQFINGTFVVGNDAAEKYNSETYPLTMNVDDMLVFDGVLSDEEIHKLKEYYDA